MSRPNPSFTVQTAIGEAADAADVLRRILALQPPYTRVDEILDMLRHGLLYGPSFHAEVSVYEDLKNSGELGLLTDAKLRRTLSRLDASLERLRLSQADFTAIQQIDVDTYMVDNIDLRAVYGEITGLDAPVDGYDPDLGFIADTGFQNRILLKLDLVSHLEFAIRDVSAQLKDVQQQIGEQADE